MTKEKEIATALRAMDFLARSCNDEDLIMGWFMAGVADGDCESLSDEELVEAYGDPDTLKGVIGCFLRRMKRAQESGLYIAGIVGTREDV